MNEEIKKLLSINYKSVFVYVLVEFYPIKFIDFFVVAISCAIDSDWFDSY